VELGLKQAIRMAVDGGYDKIAWANGAQQVNHYREALQKNGGSYRVDKDAKAYSCSEARMASRPLIRQKVKTRLVMP
jgi:hypothetical protein